MKRSLVYQFRCYAAECILDCALRVALKLYPRGSWEGTITAMFICDWAAAMRRKLREETTK